MMRVVSVAARQRDRNGLAAGEVEECARVTDRAASEKIEQQRQGMARDDAIDEQRLTFERLGD